MDQIITDESGDIRSGYFYSFGVPFSEDTLAYAVPKHDENWIIAKRSPTDQEILSRTGGEPWMWAKHVGPLESDPETKHDCPVSRDHVTHSIVTAFEVELAGGGRLGDIVPEFSGNVVFSGPFAEKLRSSRLKGLDLLPVTITVNQAWGRDDGEGPALFLLRFLGRNCNRPSKVVGVENACPFCGRKPLVCPECGYWPFDCPGCGRRAWVRSDKHEGERDRRLKVNLKPLKGGPILSGRLWDGSDFIGSSPWYVTKRVVDWLLSVHAAPFYAQPVRVCVDDMSDEQKRWLERAKQPVGSAPATEP